MPDEEGVLARFAQIRNVHHAHPVEHTEGHGDKMYEAVCALGLEGIVSKRPGSFYRSGPFKMWVKVKNQKAPAATRVLE